MFLDAAIEEAEQGLAEGGIPIGAVLVHQGRVIGRGHNRRVQHGSATLHGEMDALERAGRQPARVYRESVMFMGEEALLASRGVRVEVVQDARCIRLMQQFIAGHPDLWNEDIGE